MSKPWVSAQNTELIQQRRIARKRYQNHRNPGNYNAWRESAEQADVSLANDKINNIEQMCVDADAGSKRNDTRGLFNIVQKLTGNSSSTSPQECE